MLRDQLAWTLKTEKEVKRREEKRREEKWVWKKDAKTDEADGDDVISTNMRYKLAASLQL